MTARELAGLVLLAVASVAPARAATCDHDKACLEGIADRYRAAYVKHDRSLAPFAARVRYTENHVGMEFPDGTWDTVTEELGPAVTLSDTRTGNIGIYTTIMQNETPGFLAVRLKVQGGRITEVEHIISTKRNLSSPPTPIGDAKDFRPDPAMMQPVPVAQRLPRARLIAHADGYFSTLQKNDGEIRGTRFSPDALRYENGMKFPEIEKGFKSGRYAFNERVRDRDYFLVDEERQVVMARGFIDHKGILDEFKLTDGTPTKSVFREPQTWAFLEAFKIVDDRIVSVQATFIQAPYYMRSPWTKRPDPR